jgi:regulator of protease activity HflC (stomatin/prohibitin superfamily)
VRYLSPVRQVEGWRKRRLRPYYCVVYLTKDTVPVDVDAVLFWVVWDAQKAALEVEDYRAAIAWAAQTALRDTPALRAGASVIGKMVLADILVGRDAIDRELQRIIDERTTPWGVSVSSVEIRDTPALRAGASVIIPQELEDAMSRQAQAERERQARVTRSVGESEKQIAASFADASKFYAGNPTALHLRAMNTLSEGLYGTNSPAFTLSHPHRFAPIGAHYRRAD